MTEPHPRVHPSRPPYRFIEEVDQGSSTSTVATTLPPIADAATVTTTTAPMVATTSTIVTDSVVTTSSTVVADPPITTVETATPSAIDSNRDSPIEGFELEALVGFMDAVKPLKSLVSEFESIAQDCFDACKEPKDGLTQDESAAIKFYTKDASSREISPYYLLNQYMREKNRAVLRYWHPYLRLFMHALHKLPSQDTIVYRGMHRNYGDAFPLGESYCWQFMSCTTNFSTLADFLGTGGNGTFFGIKCYSGKKIANHSAMPDENEVLLMPGVHLRVMAHLQQTTGLIMIQIEEIPDDNFKSG